MWAFVDEAALPGDDAVGLAVEGGGRDRQRGAEVIEGDARLAWSRAEAEAGEAGDVRRQRIAERARERDDLADVVGMGAGELSRVDAAEAPADQAHPAAVPCMQRTQARDEALDDGVARADVPSESPRVGVVAAVAEEPAERA